MEEMFKKLGIDNLEEKFEIYMCVEAYKEGGIEGLYKDTVKSKSKAKKEHKKEEGKDFDETRFEVSYINTKIDHISNVLQWKPIMDSAEDRKVIADELTRLAEELRNL